MCVEYNKTKQIPSTKILYVIYMYDTYYIGTQIYVFLFSMKKTRV